MNEPNESFSDDVVDELLKPLRDVTIPETVRAANRAAVQRALTRHFGNAWWRRTVAVPVPIAIAATVALVITAAATLWPSLSPPTLDGWPKMGHVVESGTAGDFAKTNGLDAGWSITRFYIQSL